MFPFPALTPTGGPRYDTWKNNPANLGYILSTSLIGTPLGISGRLTSEGHLRVQNLNEMLSSKEVNLDNLNIIALIGYDVQ